MAPWHHAPLHLLLERGAFMVTAGTYRKERHFHDRDRLDFLQDALRAVAGKYGWELHAWAVLANHYHFVAASPADPATLRRMLGKLHTVTAKAVNERDGTPGRNVWHEYWDTRLTYERSYLARLHYVNHNPVHHGLVHEATAYPWSSAAHFQQEAEPGFRRTVESMPIDRVEVRDDF